jgi:hypothetical protein
MPHCQLISGEVRALPGAPSFTPGALVQQFRAFGVSATQARTAAFRRLVLQALAPGHHPHLGYSPGTVTQHVLAVGGTWNRYPAARAGN